MTIDITNIQVYQGGNSDMYGNVHNVSPSLHMSLLINYKNLKHLDFDEVIFDLKHALRDLTGMLIVIDYEQKNNLTNSQW